MRDYVNEWLAAEKAGDPPDGGLIVRKFVCRSGLSMSIQASVCHYCSPRRDGGPWSQVEVGFPTHKLRTLSGYSAGSGVYGFVDTAAVNRIIARNGGPAKDRP